MNEPRDARPLRIIFLSSSDPLDVRSFSGVLLHMVGALREVLPSMEVLRSSRPVWFRRFQRAVLRVSGGRVDPYYWRALNRLFARRLARRWRGERILVISVVNAALVAELAASVPVLNLTDSTFELMRGFYATFSRLEEKTAARAEEDELNSIRRSVHNSFSSAWAANSAVKHYGARVEDVSVISWGCNLEDVAIDDIRPPERAGDECRLLFIGGDWLRKGGDVVASTSEILLQRGLRVRVDVVGASAGGDAAAAPSWLHHWGFLSKADEGQFNRLRELMHEADFLFLPTRQDCTPMVFSECNAYGTPAVTRDVGGVSDVIHHGINGLVLPEESTPTDFADAIDAIWLDRDRHAELRRTSRREYEQRLNWRSWAKGVAAVIRDLEVQDRI